MYVPPRPSLRLGGVLVALASLFDNLDGALARETGQTAKFGAFDSVMDRYSRRPSSSACFSGLRVSRMNPGTCADLCDPGGFGHG